MSLRERLSDAEWLIEEDGLDLARLNYHESLFVVGNGYVERVSLVGTPSAPRPAYADTAGIWPLVGLLTRHYRALDGEHGDPESRAAGLRSTLTLLAGLGGLHGATRQLDETERQGMTLLRGGLRGLECRPVVHAVERDGRYLPIRGLDVRATLDTDAFPGRSVWLFGAVLVRFLARQIGLNSSIGVTIADTGGTEILKWTPRTGSASLG